MILKLYNIEHTLIGGLKNHKDAVVESELSTGDKTLSFSWNSRNKIQIPHEYYLRTDKDEFVVKENSKGSNGYRNIVAKLNLEEIEGRVWDDYVVKECTAQYAADYALTDTGWSCISTVPKDRIRNISLKKVSSYQILEKILEAFTCEVQYDTFQKIVYLKEKVGQDKGVYFASGINLKEVSDSGDTYDYATRIIPIGADGLEITGVNDGKRYLENYQYSNKVKTIIWEDTNYTDAEALKADADYKLNEISKPKKTFQAKVADLAKMKPEYGILSYSVGDTVTIMDNKEDIHEKQRITKTVEYLNNPEKNTCDISNTVLSFEEMQKKLFAAAECIENVTTDNGTIKGSSVDAIDVTQIIGLERYIAEDINDLKVDYLYVRSEFGTPYAVIGNGVLTQADVTNLTVTGREDSALSYITELHTTNAYGDYAKFGVVEADNIAALEARIDKITATEVTTEYLEANYAKINMANVDTASIRQGFLENLMVDQGIIADRVVSGEVVATKVLTGVKIDAADISTGKLDAANIEVINLNAANITVGTINGQQIAPGAIDMSNLSESLAGTITQTEKDVEEALSQAGIANQNATGAVSIANGKSTSYYQTTAPTGGTYSKNDIWFDTDDGNRMYYYSGSGWTATQFGTNAIVASAITAEKIASSAVTAAKISTGAVSADKIAANAVTAAKIASSSVTAAKIASSAVTAVKIAAGAVTTDKLSANAVTAAKIASRTITADKIVAGSITSTEINVSDLVSTGLIGANRITAKNILVDDLNALGATIGGFTIGAKYLANNTTTLAGASDSVYVGLDGISCGKKFKVTSLGVLTASSVDLTGKITASSGKIGGFTIGTSALYNGTTSKTSTTAGIYIGTGAIRAYGSASAYTHIESGKLTCTGANIKGSLYLDNGLYMYHTSGENEEAGYSNILSWKTYSESFVISASRSWWFNSSVNIGEGLYVENNIGAGNDISASGAVYASNWLRTYGDTGWYNQTYGGGWYMKDSTYIRNFNSKHLLLSGNCYFGSTSYYINNSGGARLQVVRLGSTSYGLNNDGSAYLGGLKLDNNYLKNDSGAIGFANSTVKIGLWSSAFRPHGDYAGKATLGSSSYRWGRIYTTKAVSVSSDRNIKNNIECIEDNEKYLKFVRFLRPSRYRLNDETTGEYHTGFIAQDVAEDLIRAGLEKSDFAGLIVEDGFHSLCYEEFIPLLMMAEKNTMLRVDSHEEEIKNLKNQLYNVQFELEQAKLEIQQLKAVV